MDFRRRGKTIVFVSHSTEAVKRLCDRVCLLLRGSIAETGEVDRVLEAYHQEVKA
jgi:ABC-type polysaccharide/polyol phosphate transport system ATPase subunit